MTPVNIFLLVLVGSTISVPDVYWRDFSKGIIPEDAVIGGRDQNSKPSYIGQVFIEKGLIPTTLYSDGREVVFEYDGVKRAQKNIKILCSGNLQHFYWIPVTTETLRMVIDPVPVVGGFEDNIILNVGRVFYEDEVIVGKVTPTLWLAKPNKYTSFTSFEVLVYNETDLMVIHD